MRSWRKLEGLAIWLERSFRTSLCAGLTLTYLRTADPDRVPNRKIPYKQL